MTISYQQVGGLYGLRNWVEYGFKQSKNELVWADFRVMDYTPIKKMVGACHERLFDGHLKHITDAS